MVSNRYAPGRFVAASLALVMLAACSEPQQSISPVEQGTSSLSPTFTMASGFAGSQLARANIPDGVKLKRKNGKWEFDLNAKDPLDIAVQSLTIQAGGHSGWHSHPGPVFLQVTSGTMTFYESHEEGCTRVVRNAGEVFVESGDHAHIGRNEGSVGASAIATVFAPVGSPLRIDEPAPAISCF